MDKEVYNYKLYKLGINDTKILQNLIQNPEGLRVNSLFKYTSIKQITLYKRLEKLKKKGLVENLYPIWKIVRGQVDFCRTLLQSDNIFELHNLSYVLKLIKKPDWWEKRKPRLEKLKDWNFKSIDFGTKYEQLMNENFVIQTYPESIIIIARKRYYSNSPYEVIGQAINDVLDIISYLEEKFRFKLFPNEIPCLEIRNEDFNRLKDHLAEHCKKEGRRFLVETTKGKVWVDYSEPFGKEANTPDIQDTLERHTKDLIINKPLTNSELQSLIQAVTQNQVYMDRNIVKHFEVLENINKAINELREEIKKNGNKNSI
jgi:hypothetical protein